MGLVPVMAKRGLSAAFPKFPPTPLQPVLWESTHVCVVRPPFPRRLLLAARTGRRLALYQSRRREVCPQYFLSVLLHRLQPVLGRARVCAPSAPFRPRRLHFAARTGRRWASYQSWRREVCPQHFLSVLLHHLQPVFWESVRVRVVRPVLLAGCARQPGRVSIWHGFQSPPPKRGLSPVSAGYLPAPTTTCFGESARVCVVRPLASAQAALRS